jgi:hypothetical protein
MKEPPELFPGDHLIYTAFNPVDIGIMVKTGSWGCHIEIYIGNGLSVASRNGKGIDQYALRTDGLSCVLRPRLPFDIERGMYWFCRLHPYEKAYAWRELGNFFLPFGTVKCRGMICSVFAAHFDHHSGYHPFNIDWNPNKISPADYLKSGLFEWVWHRNFKLLTTK